MAPSTGDCHERAEKVRQFNYDKLVAARLVRPSAVATSALVLSRNASRSTQLVAKAISIVHQKSPRSLLSPSPSYSATHFQLRHQRHVRSALGHYYLCSGGAPTQMRPGQTSRRASFGLGCLCKPCSFSATPPRCRLRRRGARCVRAAVGKTTWRPTRCHFFVGGQFFLVEPLG